MWILAVAGCESTPEEPPIAAPVAVADAAQRAIEQAQSAQSTATQASYYLEALVELHGRGAFADAGRIVERLQAAPSGDGGALTATLSGAQRFRFRAIALDMALATDDGDEIERLAPMLEPLGSGQQYIAARLQARVFARAGDHGAASRALMAVAEHPLGEDLPALASSLWRQLSMLPVLELGGLAQSSSTADLRAWWALARDFSAALTSGEQERVWRQWRQRHPRHPAARLPPPGILPPAPQPRDIALLVPLSGDLAAAAEAIRDGFVAAYLQAKPDGQTVRVYDTAALSVAEAYGRAMRRGADVIVGPLTKPAVAELVALSPAVPVVALNQLSEDVGIHSPSVPGIVQLAVAVEDQAAAIAVALAAGGVERIVLFDNAQPWSVRARARLEAELDDVEVAGVGTLGGVEEVTAIAGDVLRVTASNDRHAELSRLLGIELEFVPRRRDDVDAVVALVSGQQMLSLKPALDFHFADDLAVYVPSQAIRDGLQRLDGVRVCDIPWRLHPSSLRTETAMFPASRGTSAVLFALGVDGFRVANQLARLTVHGESIAGSTGMLSLGENGRIRRRPAWAQVVGQRLVPLIGGLETDD